jgi:phytoene dehydrogenase-like protein
MGADVNEDPDVVVLGAGPNGLTAAAILAGAGLRVLVLEAGARVGGAVQTAEVTAPGYRHDLFSGFYPLTPVGPIGRLPLERYGLEWCHFNRPFGGSTPVGKGIVVERTLQQTRQRWAQDNRQDLPGWDELWTTWQRAGHALLDVLFHPLGALPPLLKMPLALRTPQAFFDFVQVSLASARSLAERSFRSEDARVWFIGSALHSDLAPEAAGGAVYSLVLLGLGQEVGMPVPRGGAEALPRALRACIEDRGGSIRTGEAATRILVRRGRAVGVATASNEIAARRAVLATVEPQQLFLRLIDEGDLPAAFARAVRRYEWGTGIFKLDCALDGLPSFHAEHLNGTGVLHLGESTAMLTLASAQTSAGLLPAHPLLIVGIHTLADPTRAPSGGHTLWIETHVPFRIAGDAADTIHATDWDGAKEAFADRIIDELERYAPGVKSLVVGRYAQSPADLAAANANLVRGDNSGGSFALHQQLVLRPVPGWFRHRTPVRGLYVGGASTHPGAGVHGAAGANAARMLLGDLGLARRFGRS